MRLPILGGSYVARSVIAAAQRCVNYFPEVNPKDSPVPLTLYQRPGFRPLVHTASAAPVRCLYRASNGQGFTCVGQNIYYIDVDFKLHLLGTMDVPPFTPSQSPVKMADNGTDILIVDGSSSGYSVNLQSHAFSKIVDQTGAFTGGNLVDYLDTFLIWNVPGTNLFGSTLSNVLKFDALYVAGKAGYPDPLVSLIVNKRQILLLGTLKSEIWYNAGNPLFPFAELPGTYIEHGCVAPYSVASQDVEVFWLGQDLQGIGIVFMQKGYATTRISNHALEFAIQEMIKNAQPIDSAIGYCYQQGGHVFYVLTFPHGNQTWVYDAAVEDPSIAWHQRAWTDDQGNLNRDRSNCHAFINGKNVVGDWQNGTLYELDQNYFVDTVNGIDGPISYIRSFQHVQMLPGPGGSPLPSDGKLMTYSSFALDFEAGMAPLDFQGQQAKLSVRVSLDRGKTFGEAVTMNAGALGYYNAQPKFPPMGTGRDVIFEVSHNVAGPAALQGAWVDVSLGTN